MLMRDIMPNPERGNGASGIPAALVRAAGKKAQARPWRRPLALVALLVLGLIMMRPLRVLGEGGTLEEAVSEIVDAIIPEGGVFDSLGLVGPEPPAPAAESPSLTEKARRVSSDIRLEKEYGADGRDKYRMDALDGSRLEIADAGEDGASADPSLKASKWNGEAQLKVRLPHAKGGQKMFRDNVLSLKGEKLSVEVYPKSPETITEDIAGVSHSFTINDEGGVEFDLVLDEAPESNAFEFPFESQGLDFHYQPPLDSAHPTWADRDGDGAADYFLPEIAVGSYAVYRSGEEGGLKSEEEAQRYKTGKAFHIYRPRITDDNGVQVWGDLNIDSGRGVLTVTVDPVWLAAAAYPVRVDPNIGVTTVGAGTSSIASTGNIISPAGVTGAGGIVNSVTAYVKYTVSGNMKGNIYDSAYAPTHASGTAQVALPSSLAWTTMNFTAGPSISSGNTYYIGLWVAQTFEIAADNYGSATTTLLDQEAYGGAWPNPATTTTLQYGTKYSIYATYTETKTSPSGVGISGGGMMMF